MTNFKLSGHFNLIEFERSSTATANHIDNTCPPQFIPALQQLCKEVLEPLSTPLVKQPTSRFPRHLTPNGAMAKPIPTRTSSTAGSTGSSRTPTSTKPSSKPPTAKTSGYTFLAERTRARIDIKSSVT